MIRRLTPSLLALCIVASGCSTNLGRVEPACGYDSISNGVIISAQSVAGTAYVPCINDLKPGWHYEHLEARSGQSRFWLSSDRVGDRFLEVTLESSCSLLGAERVDSDEADTELYIRDEVEDFRVQITVVPEGNDEDHEDYAAEIVSEIGATRIGNRLVQATIDLSDLPTSERIRSALAEGRAVFVVGARDYEERTVEMHVVYPGQTAVTVMSGIEAGEAVEEIADHLGEPTYRATWHYSFEKGCVTYQFDARGSGVEKIAADVRRSLSFTDIAPIREFGETTGYVIP